MKMYHRSTLMTLKHLLNKINDNGRTGSAWKLGDWGKREGCGAEGKMTQTVFARVD
jgi:hypothetical protein